MAKNFTSQLKLTAKDAHGGNPTINKTYTLHSKDEMELMDQSMHLTGAQDDAINLNRHALVNDSAHANRKPPAGGGVDLTIESRTGGSDGVPAHELSVTWKGLDQAMLQQMVAAINTRLVAVGITP